jgi:Amt family ammonium transporter
MTLRLLSHQLWFYFSIVEPWAAMIIGACAGLIYLGGSHLLITLRLDDAVDAIPVHMVNGTWGLIAVGLLASPRKLELTFGEEKPHVGWFYSWSRGSGDARLLACQIVGILWIIGWVLGVMMPFFIWLDWKGWFRSDPLEEIVGLDTSYHGGLILMGGDESVNPEYISQFKKQRSNMRQRKRHLNTQNSLDEDFENGDGGTEPESGTNHTNH